MHPKNQLYDLFSGEIKNTTILFIEFLLALTGVLLRVAFFTLVERKIIGLIHYRKGPTKSIIIGVSQPLADAIKLISKETTKTRTINFLIYYSGPAIGLATILSVWGTFEYTFIVCDSKVKILVRLAILRLSVYRFIIIRWGSNRKYTVLGGQRVIAQIVSYEVCFILIVVLRIYSFKTIEVKRIIIIQESIWRIVSNWPLFLLWIIICIAERNRTPFDLAEGESEIVSGFNLEYGRGLFALIFIREYGSIIFLRYLTSVLFLGISLTILKTIIISFVFVWVRRRLPRARYDLLILACWKNVIPFTLAIIIIKIALIT